MSVLKRKRNESKAEYVNTANQILQRIIEKAELHGFAISRCKTVIRNISKPFKYCKAKYNLLESGKVIVIANRDCFRRARHRFRYFCKMVKAGKMSYLDVWQPVNSIFAYLRCFDSHNRVIDLKRYFFSIFGFSPEKYRNFSLKECSNAIYNA